ncbi:hypothetical protein [Kitasatospora sp. NE20-6]|uniref:hypothetical protein n=1 Tax=Kitasatospora sp. NE20-6 TaxID=2859066 RepID=UPI0038B4183D
MTTDTRPPGPPAFSESRPPEPVQPADPTGQVCGAVFLAPPSDPVEVLPAGLPRPRASTWPFSPHTNT